MIANDPLNQAAQTTGFTRFLVCLVLAPVLAFGLAWGLVVAGTWISQIFILLFLGLMVFLALAKAVAMAGQSFSPRLVVAFPTAFGAVAGLWWPWFASELGGPAKARVFVFRDPEHLLTRIEKLSINYGYSYESRGDLLNFGDYTYQIWIGLTVLFALAGFAGVFWGNYFWTYNPWSGTEK